MHATALLVSGVPPPSPGRYERQGNIVNYTDYGESAVAKKTSAQRV